MNFPLLSRQAVVGAPARPTGDIVVTSLASPRSTATSREDLPPNFVVFDRLLDRYVRRFGAPPTIGDGDLDHLIAAMRQALSEPIVQRGGRADGTL